MSEMKQPKFKFGQTLFDKHTHQKFVVNQITLSGSVYIYSPVSGSIHGEDQLTEVKEPLRVELIATWKILSYHPSMGPWNKIAYMWDVPLVDLEHFIDKKTKVTIEEVL